MDEFALIEKFFAARVAPRDDVRLGIGDDAAITRLASDVDLVIATDTLVEGTHFPPGTPAHALGHRCLAVNLSDLAAMGARPLWCTLALSLPDGSAHWVEEFAAGFVALADHEEIALIGGDTVRGPLSLTVTVHGSVARGEGVARSGAEPGHGIYVTGTPGRAAAGLAMLGTSAGRIPESSELTDRFLYPQPRVREGRDVARIASAMIDVSDGLHVDLMRLLAASGVGARLDVEAIPLSAEARERFGDDAALEFALTGGDDYELCLTVPHDCAADLERIAGHWDCDITRIGETSDDVAVGWFERGHPREIDDTSFRHFAAEEQ